MRPSHFYRGQRCIHCNKSIKKTTKQFSDEVNTLTNGEYKVLGNYINNQTLISILHNNCNKEYKVRPSNFLNGYRCPHCFKNKTKTTKEFIAEVEKLTNKEYIVNGIYTNNKTKISIIHTKCNKSFEMRPNDFISGHRCPHCAVLPHDSKGCQSIKKYLNDNEYYYQTEYTFKDCKNKNVLPFDFCLFDDNDKPILLIEFDGKQHFEPMSSFGGVKEFNNMVKRDNIKNEYCKKNSINLIRISFKEVNNIDEILQKVLKDVQRLSNACHMTEASRVGYNCDWYPETEGI